MEGLKNLLYFLYNNWTSVLVCVGLIFGIIQKTKNYLEKSEDEKVEIAKSQIKETLLEMVSTAESEYENFNKAGAIKRAKVIKEIFEQYPILSLVANQDEIIKWLDNEIDCALNELRKIINDKM